MMGALVVKRLSNISIHRVNNKTAPSIFLTKFCKPSLAYPTNFWAYNFLVPTLKVNIEFQLGARYFGTTF